MDLVKNILSAFPKLSMDQVNALIALGGLALAAFSIFVVYSVVKKHS